MGAGKVSCDALSAWCNTTALVKFSESSPERGWHSLNWVYLESFARKFHGQINLDKHTVFLLGASHCTVGKHCQEFGRLSEWNYWYDSCSGWWKQRDLFSSQWPLQEVWRWWRLFLEALSIFPWTWCDPFSACVVNVQPRQVEPKTQMWARPRRLYRPEATRFRARQIHRQLISAQCGELLWWCRHRQCHFCVSQEIWRMRTCT